MSGVEVAIVAGTMAIISHLVSVVMKVGSLFKKKPKPCNDTLQQIHVFHCMVSPDQESKLAQAASKRQGEELAAGKLRAKEERVASQERKLAMKAAAQRQGDELNAMKLTIKEERAASRLREQAAKVAAQRQAEEVAAMRVQVREERVASQQREQIAMKATADATLALQQGIQPVEWPTKTQIEDAKKRIKYDPEKLHFAVCGSSGSGKSSLVNAFRGLKSTDLHAAKVGVTETTLTIDRYPDPCDDYPFSRFVWYDIPGAGTLSVRDWQYFNEQGLFVFDFIVVVYDSRFSSIDVGIIENCHRFRIPVFIVRSKADQHIANMVRDKDGCEPGKNGYKQIYAEELTNFVLKTRSNFAKQKQMMIHSSMKRKLELDRSDSVKYFIESQVESSYEVWLSKQIVYIVSAEKLRGLILKLDPNQEKQVTESVSYLEWLSKQIVSIASASKLRILGQKDPNDQDELTDEVLLYQNLLSTAVSRRYSESDVDDKSLRELVPYSC